MIEINEFNTALFRAAVAKMPLPNIERMLAFPETVTTTDDRTESGYLEPWVQWVSVHTGAPASEHKIKNLGDVPNLEHKQIWETLGTRGVTSGIWGVMNGGMRDAKNCRFFLPDPWTFSEQGFPAELNGLLDLPRYLSKNYLVLSKQAISLKTARLLWFLVSSGAVLDFLAELPRLIASCLQFGPKHFVFICFFDCLSTRIFLRYKLRFTPAFSLIFLNSIAHLQHHYWTEGTEHLTSPLRFGLAAMDRIMGMLFDNAGEGDGLIILNALSQMNTNHEAPWILFRQKDPAAFLRTVKIPFERVEQMMTNDAHVFFESAELCRSAVKALAAASIDGRPAFHVEADEKNPLKLFYRVDFTDPVTDGTQILVNGRDLKFLDVFESIVIRTGRHVPTASLFARGVDVPPKMKNHELNKILVAHFSHA